MWAGGAQAGGSSTAATPGAALPLPLDAVLEAPVLGPVVDLIVVPSEVTIPPEPALDPLLLRLIAAAEAREL